MWSSRSLSLLKKITAIKFFQLPMVVFKILILPVLPQKTFTKNLMRLLNRFIWGSNCENTGRQKLCNWIGHSRANMVNVKIHFIRLKVKWISVFFFDDSFASQWKLVESTVETLILNSVLSSILNIEHFQIKKLIPFSAFEKFK